MRTKLLILSPIALVFLIFGVYLLVASFYQDHPATFMALFFSSSLIILISVVCIVGMLFRLRQREEVVEEQQ